MEGNTPQIFCSPQNLLFPEKILLKHIIKTKSCLTKNAFCPPKLKSCLRACLKQRSRTHLVLRQRSSQLQKYKAARMSRRIAVNQKVRSGDGGHPWADSLKLVNYTRIENAHKARKQICFFIMWLLYVLLLKGKEQIRACVSRYD